MVKKYEVWIADLEPSFGTEAGKIRPVVIVQSDLLNQVHPSSLICPITTNLNPGASILRVHLSKGEAQLTHESEILIDQVRAIDNRRLVKKLGSISATNRKSLDENLRIVLDLM